MSAPIGIIEFTDPRDHQIALDVISRVCAAASQPGPLRPLEAASPAAPGLKPQPGPP